MTSRKKFIADLLLGVQICGAFVLCGSQFLRILETVTGLSLSMFLLMEGFCVLHLLLALGAHRVQPSRVTRQAIFTYVLWIVLMACNVVALLAGGRYQWSSNDTTTIFLALSGTALVIVLAKVKGLAVTDPMPKGLLAITFKALPQWMMAVKIASDGGAGLPGLAVVAANITILIRIGQVVIAVREAGWDKNRLWLCVSEVINELSWATVTVVWALWRFS